jgi:hypothetical protein
MTNQKKRKAEHRRRGDLAAYAQLVTAFALLVRSWMTR